MCDKELHRGKYVCVHYVPWAVDTASATTKNPGRFRRKILAFSTQRRRATPPHGLVLPAHR